MAVIAWIGLGRMGLPMASRLLDAGHEVRGVEPDPEAAARATAAGLTLHAQPQALAGADAVFTMLPAAAEVLAVLEGPRGVLAGVAPGTVVVDSSTIDITAARRLHEAAAERGVLFADAPVSGGVAGAGNGTLTFMVGGSEAAVTAVRPLLSALAGRVVHTGGPGTGQVAKIVNNMIFGACLAATCEGVLLGERLGLDPAVFYEIATSSTSDNFALRAWYPVPGVVAEAPASREFSPGFTHRLLVKDLTLAVAAGAASGTPVDTTETVLRLFAAAVSEGAGELDCTSLIRQLAAAARRPEPSAPPSTVPAS